MANTLTGRVLSVGQTVKIPTKNGSDFVKRELILDASRYDEFTGEKKPNYPLFQFTQKRCEELDGLSVGDFVEVSFILSGRAYQKDGATRYITDVVGYKVERREKQAPVQAEAPTQPQPASIPNAHDEFPF